MAARTQIIWLAEARRLNGRYLYINEVGKADHTPCARFALKCLSEDRCRAYIEEFGLADHFHPTAHLFE